MGRASMEIERKLLRLLHGRKTRTRLPEIHAHFLRHGLDGSNLLLAHFISICGSLCRMDYANGIFGQIQNPNILVFNSMIKGYSLVGPFRESLCFFYSMKGRGIWADEYTYAPLLKSCSCLCDLRIGKCVHGEVLRSGFHQFGSVRIGLVELYASSGARMEDAEKVFDEMLQRDVIVWNLMIRGYCESGDVEKGLKLFRQMDERSITTWNSVISSLSKRCKDGKALEFFCEMRDEGFDLDEATVVTVLPICARLGASEIGQWVHSHVESNDFLKDFVSVWNALVDFYCKCGDVELGVSIFNRMKKRNVISWNAMISGLAVNGKAELGISLFEEMIAEGCVNPNEATFLGVLTCCSYTGWTEKGREFFDLMRERYEIEPGIEHYGGMIDMLGRSGRVSEAFELLRNMHVNITPNAALWGSLLSACRTHGDAELAEVAAKELIKVEPWNSGNYVLLSNLYAEEGRWEEVERVRALIKEKCLRKPTGQSSITIDLKSPD